MKALWLVLLLSSVAWGDRAADEARRLNDRAAGAYALGRYSDAADLYEQAFAAKPIPELLYNAAQAHRFAGNKARALQLYENCLRVYSDKLGPHRDDIELHITELRFALASQSEPRPAPAAQEKEKAPAPIAAAPVKAPPPLDLTDDEPEPPRPKKKSRAWIWGVVVGVAAAGGLAIGLGVGLSSSTEYPSPSLGSLKAK